jgi:hypothetical protein
MTTEPVRAGSGWLALREPADATARSPELVEILRPHLAAGGLSDGLVIHDLGSGTGSMARWLAPQLGGPQTWVLHDRDTDLLEHAAIDAPAGSVDGAEVTVETRRSDVTRLEPGVLAGASLITASALLDMFTEDELERFVTSCVGAGCPALVTLSVVGQVELAPAHPFDPTLRDAFNAHQRRQTADGRLLGPQAARAAAAAFVRRGYEVVERPSPWRLGHQHRDLAAEWLTGWVGAACEQAPELAEVARAYARSRLADVAAGTTSITVHHLDLLALAQ